MVSKDSNFVNLAVDSRSISVYWGMLNFVIHSITTGRDGSYSNGWTGGVRSRA